MRFSAPALLALFASGVIAQKTPGPSPTESVGCEPHGDHWHCDGPAPTMGPATGTAAAATTVPVTSSASHDHDHDHDHDDHDDHHTAGKGSLKPSPTESVGCEPHGDHW